MSRPLLTSNQFYPYIVSTLETSYRPITVASPCTYTSTLASIRFLQWHGMYQCCNLYRERYLERRRVVLFRELDRRREVSTIDCIKRRGKRLPRGSSVLWRKHPTNSPPLEIYRSLASFIFGIKLHQSMSSNPNMTRPHNQCPLNVTLHPQPPPTAYTAVKQCSEQHKPPKCARFIILLSGVWTDSKQYAQCYSWL